MFDSFEIKADARTYAVDVEPGAALPFLRGLGRDALVICDAIFAERFAALPCSVLSLPALEEHKTLDEAARLVEAARAAGLTRRGTIVAVGGGIVQDVACFVASVFMRGVAWTYLPTTVLAMVDSCIGGKSSINVGRYKNLAGTMHPPARVLVDPEFAETLALEHRAGGLCEAAKIAFARGTETFERYVALGVDPEVSGTALAEAVVLSLRAKRWFVEIDEFDRKERLTLNFGHTFGHALESASNFAINHGAAVGLGMLCALHFAEDRGSAATHATHRLAAHTRMLLGAVPNLAAEFAAIDMAKFEAALLSDKKHTPDQLTLVLPVAAACDGLPLGLCRFSRDTEVLRDINGAVEATQRMITA